MLMILHSIGSQLNCFQSDKGKRRRSKPLREILLTKSDCQTDSFKGIRFLLIGNLTFQLIKEKEKTKKKEKKTRNGSVFQQKSF